MPFFDIYGGSDGAETILTSKYSGSTSSVSKMVDFGPPGAEKLIFSDKTLACLNDCSPKRMPFNSLFYTLCPFFFFTINSFFLRITQFFHSFNYSFNNAVKIFIQQIYSLKKSAKYIHSMNLFIQKIKIIHSKKIFI